MQKMGIRLANPKKIDENGFMTFDNFSFPLDENHVFNMIGKEKDYLVCHVFEQGDLGLGGTLIQTNKSVDELNAFYKKYCHVHNELLSRLKWSVTMFAVADYFNHDIDKIYSALSGLKIERNDVETVYYHGKKIKGYEKRDVKTLEEQLNIAQQKATILNKNETQHDNKINIER
ncbi:hypothetical protein GMA11_06225 [Granulicatella sp. zg-ZJ]|uniref:hypothetical protein n=1 Tax=Granulicatella sp. zg-ZJ TaxID=2678504 RepID=UPI0013D3A550|nr:hypothetical protein [Granulicatella sp. zg-ZJ]NEW62442.1 hypothetical protein [Granulicatella sp. zg-ZJ]NEW62988.1 hypothetical protein [Granulicatella sp. zg-ZJ]